MKDDQSDSDGPVLVPMMFNGRVVPFCAGDTSTMLGGLTLLSMIGQETILMPHPVTKEPTEIPVTDALVLSFARGVAGVKGTADAYRTLNKMDAAKAAKFKASLFHDPDNWLFASDVCGEMGWRDIDELAPRFLEISEEQTRIGEVFRQLLEVFTLVYAGDRERAIPNAVEQCLQTYYQFAIERDHSAGVEAARKWLSTSESADPLSRLLQHRAECLDDWYAMVETFEPNDETKYKTFEIMFPDLAREDAATFWDQVAGGNRADPEFVFGFIVGALRLHD